MNRFNRFVSLNFAAFLTLSAAGAFAASAEAAGVPKDDDTRKDGTLRDVPSQHAVNSGACFFAAAKGKSLVQGPCDVRALQVAAKAGQVYAQNQLGLVSALVVAQGTDIRQARSWFEEAARRGYAPAQVNLAVTYMNGWGVPQNYGAALNWLNTAAKQGHPSAYGNLGILYMNGWGVRRDYAEAFKDLEIAANAGNAGAQSNLGYLYDGGLGVVQDYSAAARWYHLAAENGNALGQNNLADLYLRGQGVRQSYPQAFHWFQKSAQQGHTGARIKLGFLLMNGLGTAKDSSAAYAWILSASQAGDHRGDDYLIELERDLDQPHLAQATQQARSLEGNAAQRNVRVSLVP
jgi:TPR repeat protein